MLDSILNFIRPLIPAKLFSALQRPYHFTLAFLAALMYGFPSRKIKVIAVTGTKGKSSTTEIVNAILEKAGKKTAVSNTIRFKVGDVSTPNLYKMSMPGRFAMQKLIRQAVNGGCDYFIAEMTSQGALFFRHKFIGINTLIFTNLSPEHIEAHGSYENYVAAKLSIAQSLASSGKHPTTIIANTDEKEGARFLACNADNKLGYSVNDLAPFTDKEAGLEFTLDGTPATSPLSGLFNLYNIAGTIACAESEGISSEHIRAAIEAFGDIPGRVEKIDAGQDFEVVVDYAHTPDSLEKLYKIFQPEPTAERPTDGHRLIAILGGTGGGRDTWKRKEMGRLADLYCDEIILTDEDPYDESPLKIVADVAMGISKKKPSIIMDRREAIAAAFKLAKIGDTILITGKGTDPYIMGPKGTKTPWSDSRIALEELRKLKGGN